MVTLLAKLFIRDHENVTDPGVRQAYGILCGIVGICFNLILFTTKALAGLFSHSIAITADAFNNLSDAASSIITLVGFRMAGQKPDSDHPFGHGRIEYISGLLVSILIVLMGFELVKSSVSKIFHPEAPDYSPVIIGILVFSIVVKCYMSLYKIMSLTKGGPSQSTESISYLIYNNGMSGGQFGFQSANAFVFFIVIVAISLFQMKFLGSKEEQL